MAPKKGSAGELRSESIVHAEHSLLGYALKQEKNFALLGGSHDLSFSLKIPPDLLPSTEHKGFIVRYFLKATMAELPFKKTTQSYLPIKVMLPQRRFPTTKSNISPPRINPKPRISKDRKQVSPRRSREQSLSISRTSKDYRAGLRSQLENKVQVQPNMSPLTQARKDLPIFPPEYRFDLLVPNYVFSKLSYPKIVYDTQKIEVDLFITSLVKLPISVKLTVSLISKQKPHLRFQGGFKSFFRNALSSSSNSKTIIFSKSVMLSGQKTTVLSNLKSSLKSKSKRQSDEKKYGKQRFSFTTYRSKTSRTSRNSKTYYRRSRSRSRSRSGSSSGFGPRLRSRPMATLGSMNLPSLLRRTSSSRMRKSSVLLFRPKSQSKIRPKMREFIEYINNRDIVNIRSKTSSDSASPDSETSNATSDDLPILLHQKSIITQKKELVIKNDSTLYQKWLKDQGIFYFKDSLKLMLSSADRATIMTHFQSSMLTVDYFLRFTFEVTDYNVLAYMKSFESTKKFEIEKSIAFSQDFFAKSQDESTLSSSLLGSKKAATSLLPPKLSKLTDNTTIKSEKRTIDLDGYKYTKSIAENSVAKTEYLVVDFNKNDHGISTDQDQGIIHVQNHNKYKQENNDMLAHSASTFTLFHSEKSPTYASYFDATAGASTDIKTSLNNLQVPAASSSLQRGSSTKSTNLIQSAARVAGKHVGRNESKSKKLTNKLQDQNQTQFQPQILFPNPINQVIETKETNQRLTKKMSDVEKKEFLKPSSRNLVATSSIKLKQSQSQNLGRDSSSTIQKELNQSFASIGSTLPRTYTRKTVEINCRSRYGTSNQVQNQPQLQPQPRYILQPYPMVQPQYIFKLHASIHPQPQPHYQHQLQSQFQRQSLNLNTNTNQTQSDVPSIVANSNFKYNRSVQPKRSFTHHKQNRLKPTQPVVEIRQPLTREQKNLIRSNTTYIQKILTKNTTNQELLKDHQLTQKPKTEPKTIKDSIAKNSSNNTTEPFVRSTSPPLGQSPSLDMGLGLDFNRGSSFSDSVFGSLKQYNSFVKN